MLRRKPLSPEADAPFSATERIERYALEVQTRSNREIAHTSELVRVQSLQDLIWREHGNNALKAYQSAWFETSQHLAAKALDSACACEANNGGAQAKWMFETQEHVNGTLMQTNIAVEAARFSVGNLYDFRVAEASAFPDHDMGKHDQDLPLSLPKRVRGMQMRGIRVDSDRARILLRTRLAEEFAHSADAITATAVTTATGYDQETPRKIIEVNIYKTWQDDESREGTGLKHDLAGHILDDLKDPRTLAKARLEVAQQAKMPHKLNVTEHYLRKRYRQSRKPLEEAFSKLAAINDLLRRSY